MAIIVQTKASASARDYEWLKRSVAGWLHRGDLDDVIPDFVVIAEQRINENFKKRLIAPVPPLADNGGANWLIEKHSGLYLAATMCAALLYTRDTSEWQKWEAKYSAALEEPDYDNLDGTAPLVLRNPTS